jgi:hypothetical protein
VALLDALRAITAFEPPDELPPCDLEELAGVLDAHGLAPLASYHLETRRLGAQVPPWFRERLLPLYQGTVNDNVFKLMTLKGAVRGVDVPAVVLDGAAYVDWLYPHLAFRPIGDLRLAVRADDGERFAEQLAAAGFGSVTTGEGGHTASLSDGRLDIRIQEGIVAGRALDAGLFDRRDPYPALGPAMARPAADDALLCTVADLAAMGLHGPLLLYVDLRELLSLPELGSSARIASVVERAGRLGLSRALHGACALAARFFPQVRDAAEALSPVLGPAERVAVAAVVDAASDPARLRVPRGTQELARKVVAP